MSHESFSLKNLKKLKKFLRKTMGFFYIKEAGKNVIKSNRFFFVLIPSSAIVLIFIAMLDSHDSSFIRRELRGSPFQGSQLPGSQLQDNQSLGLLPQGDETHEGSWGISQERQAGSHTRKKQPPLLGGISDISASHSDETQEAHKRHGFQGNHGGKMHESQGHENQKYERYRYKGHEEHEGHDSQRHQNQRYRNQRRRSYQRDQNQGNGRSQRVAFSQASPIKYKAPQVIVREEDHESLALPTGTYFEGQLLSAIDTRQEGAWVRVRLPKGGRFKERDRGQLPKETILIGSIRYPGKGKKVFIHFSKGVLPNGNEFGLQAEALAPRSHRPGLSGKYHSRRGGKMASILGLSMVAGMTETLTQKEALGRSKFGSGSGSSPSSVSITPKATLKNAFYHGASKVADMESQRQASELNHLVPYVTIPIETNLVVSLTAPMKGDFLHE